MPPSSTLPGSGKPTSSFGSVEWLSQSSHVGRLHTSRPADVCWGIHSVSATASSRWEAPQAAGVEELRSSEESVPGTSTAGRSGGVWGSRPSQMGSWREASTPQPVPWRDEGPGSWGWGPALPLWQVKASPRKQKPQGVSLLHSLGFLFRSLPLEGRGPRPPSPPLPLPAPRPGPHAEPALAPQRTWFSST